VPNEDNMSPHMQVFIFLEKNSRFFFTEVDHSFIGDFNVKVICQ
jgi:hypothetical protein